MDDYWAGTLIRLRAVEPGDAAAHAAFNASAESGLLDQLYPPVAIGRVEQWAVNQASAKFDDDSWSFQMERLTDGALVGGIATHHCDPRVGVFSYGLHVFPAYRGNGYAREAICLVLRYYFQERRYQKVQTGVYAFNTSSRRLHERLGFVVEGRTRRNVLTRGELVDTIQVGMTVEEFRDLHGDYWLPPYPSDLADADIE